MSHREKEKRGEGGHIYRTAVRCPMGYNITLPIGPFEHFMPSFLLKDAKYVLLTYPQVSEEADQALPGLFTDFFHTIPAEFTAARERHADGGIHFHVFVDFGGRRFSTRSQRYFDLGGCHPNIQRVGRTPDLVWDYTTKDGDIVAGSAERPASPADQSARDREQQGEQSASAWARIVCAETREEFFDLIRAEQPRALVCSYLSIARYADYRYNPVPESYQHPEDYEFRLDSYPVLLDWVDESLRGGLDR